MLPGEKLESVFAWFRIVEFFSTKKKLKMISKITTPMTEPRFVKVRSIPEATPGESLGADLMIWLLLGGKKSPIENPVMSKKVITGKVPENCIVKGKIIVAARLMDAPIMQSNLGDILSEALPAMGPVIILVTGKAIRTNPAFSADISSAYTK